MSIKTFFTVVLVHDFEQTFHQDTLRRLRNILHRGEDLNAVVFQVFAVDRHLILVTGETI